MTDIKRYDPSPEPNTDGDMFEDEDGSYVTIADHRAAVHAAFTAGAEAMRERIAFVCGVASIRDVPTPEPTP